MMITPTKRRSLLDHQRHYSNVAPKVQTRWPNGIPLIRNGKRVLTRRRSEPNLSIQASALLSPESYTNFRDPIIEENESDPESHDEGFTISSSDDSNDQHNISTSHDISTHLDIVSGHFKNLFSQLENHLENNAKTATEKRFIESHIKDFKEHARQIDFMINELIERGERLERFIHNRSFESDSHWSEWKP